MKLFPAIDLYEGKAVRLLRGDYTEMTIYSNAPEQVANAFCQCGASFIHMVDLEGAKTGSTPNISSVEKIVKQTSLFVEVGGGIRSEETIKKYLDIGVGRAILGTIAVTDPEFLAAMVSKYGKKIAVGVDIKDGMVAIHGWTNKSLYTGDDFMKILDQIGVQTVICTDISKDGAMSGANHELYRKYSQQYPINLIASGGVSSMHDIQELKKIGIYGAIIGKAYYTGTIDLKEAIQEAE